MIKSLICLLWGHHPFIKIDTVVHEPIDITRVKITGCDSVEDVLKIVRGSTSTSLQCPRCCKIKVVTL